MKVLPWVIIVALLTYIGFQEAARRTNEFKADSLRVLSDSVQRASIEKQAGFDSTFKSLSDTLQKVRKDFKSKSFAVIKADAVADSITTELNSTNTLVSQTVADLMEARLAQIKARDAIIVNQRDQIDQLGKLLRVDSTIIAEKDKQIIALDGINHKLSILLANKKSVSINKYALIGGIVLGYALNEALKGHGR